MTDPRRRILKFFVQPGATTVYTAAEPRFLAVGAQGPGIVVWAEATVGFGVETVLAARMTGEEPPVDGDYLGTATQSDGVVVHVYRVFRDMDAYRAIGCLLMIASSLVAAAILGRLLGMIREAVWR